ncbi:hypothetical protein MMC24_006254 [Lignoscripta atroalba]|nr:hypothetical protein [Lignoscripta atroalba]
MADDIMLTVDGPRIPKPIAIEDLLLTRPMFSHHLFLLTLDDKLFLAPIRDPKKVIDVGTGTGIWAQDFADQFPHADVVGTDLSPIQPDFAPPNLRFEIDDCCSTWTYPPNHFDFIHIRCMYGSVAEWPAFYFECYDMLYDVYRAKIQRRHLVPGGYIEQAEISVRVCSDIGDIDPDSVWGENNRLFFCAGEASGRTLVIQEKLKGLIEEAGFVDVVEHQYRWPLGAWSQDQKLRDLGRWNQHRWEEGLEGWSMAFCTRIMGWSYEQVKAWNVETKRTMRDRSLHIYQNVFVSPPMSRHAWVWAE